MKLLPVCLLRKETDQVDVYYCRNTKVHTTDNLVSVETCRRCIWHDTICEFPRPEEYAARKEVSPNFVARAIGAGSALVEFIADGMQLVDQERLATRLTICGSCEDNLGNWCRRCGCNLAVKARGRAFDCPIGKWPKQLPDDSHSPSVQ